MDVLSIAGGLCWPGASGKSPKVSIPGHAATSSKNSLPQPSSGCSGSWKIPGEEAGSRLDICMDGASWEQGDGADSSRQSASETASTGETGQREGKTSTASENVCGNALGHKGLQWQDSGQPCSGCCFAF